MGDRKLRAMLTVEDIEQSMKRAAGSGSELEQTSFCQGQHLCMEAWDLICLHRATAPNS